MEIVVKNASYAAYKKLNFTLSTDAMIGIYTDDLSILKLLSSSDKVTGSISYDGVTNKKENLGKLRREVAYFESSKPLPVLETVDEQLRLYFYQNHLPVKDLENRIPASFRIVGLSQEILKRNYATLSFAEQYFVRLAMVLIPNPKLLILEEPYVGLDEKNQQKLWKLLDLLRTKYQKGIIIGSRDADTILKRSDECLIFFHHDCVKMGKPRKLFTESVETLKLTGVPLPNAIDFVALAKKKKQVKLQYQVDILDVIKDVYKHVSTK